MSEKKILITGATGFIGAYLLHYLLHKGYRNIRAIRRKGSPLHLIASVEDQVEWLEADLLDLVAMDEAMKNVQQVYHCAAIVSFDDRDRRRLIKENPEGTANVVNLALIHGVEKLVHVSSIAALGRRNTQSLIDEKTPWVDDHANTPYGISKYLSEMEVWRGIAEGLNAVIVNPSNVMGSGFWQGRTSTGQVFYKIWKGMPFYPLGGTGFVDVRDVVRFMVQIMNSPVGGERFIVSAENLSFRTVFHEIAAVLNVKPPNIPVTPLVRETAWRAAWAISLLTGRRPFITRQAARASARAFFYDNSKSLKAIPFSYTPVRQTILETGKQFLEGVNKGFPPVLLSF